MRFETLRYEWNPANPLSGTAPVVKPSRRVAT
jgi:hypothetical protein